MSLGIEKPLKKLVLDGSIAESVLQTIFNNFSYVVDNNNLIITIDCGDDGEIWLEFDSEGVPVGSGFCIGPPENWVVWEIGNGRD